MGQTSSQDRHEMAQAAQRVEEAGQTLNKIKSDLGNEHQQLQGMWKGAASSAFTKVYTEFDGDLDKVLQALNRLHETLVQVKINYQASEDQQEQEVNRIAGLL